MELMDLKWDVWNWRRNIITQNVWSDAHWDLRTYVGQNMLIISLARLLVMLTPPQRKTNEQNVWTIYVWNNVVEKGSHIIHKILDASPSFEMFVFFPVCWFNMYTNMAWDLTSQCACWAFSSFSSLILHRCRCRSEKKKWSVKQRR